MSDCNSNCSSCDQTCGERTAPQSFAVPPNPYSNIQKVIAVVSGKGGVGKSTVTASLAAAMASLGKTVGVLDADITGPSIPRLFGLSGRAVADERGILPALTEGGISVMSLNLLMGKETDPVVWRGPVLAGTVKQFWSDVVWGELEYLFLDMPPGTGDVPLTVYQSLPIDGVVVVTTPQDLVSMIVTKAVNMARLMNIPVLGLVENYSYFQCPDCGSRHAVFGESKLEEVADQLGLPVLARLPINPALAAAGDRGEIETFSPNYLADLATQLEQG